MKKTTKTLVIITLLLITVTGRTLTESTEIEALTAGTGLEVLPGTKIPVVIERLDDECEKLGLICDLIKSKVELQLHRNGITVCNKEDQTKSDVYLYVQCNVKSNAFSIKIHFNRIMYYWVGKNKHIVVASPYHKDVVGIHGFDREFIIQGLIDLVDIFSNDFIKSNQKKTMKSNPGK